MKRRSLLGLAAALPAPWARAQKPPAPPGKGGPLVLGQSAPFSGPAAQLGVQLNRGARLCFDQVNEKGGIGGQKIELRSLDDGYDPARCKANTERFLADDVFALFGYVGTPTCLAALPLLKDGRMPFFAPFTGAMALREPLARNIFHVRASYDDETALIVRQLANLGLKRIAVFRQNDSYGQAGLEGVEKALGRLSMAPVAVATVERNSIDVAAAVKAIVPLQPDAVVQISAYKSCAAFIREARKAGYGGTFYNVSFVGTKALADELGRDALGVVVSQVMPFPYSSTVGIVRDYLDAVHAAGADVQPNYSGLEGYVDARVFVDGLRKARNITRDGLIAGLEGLQHQDYGGFALNLGPKEHVASRFVELTMLTADGGLKR